MSRKIVFILLLLGGSHLLSPFSFLRANKILLIQNQDSIPILTFKERYFVDGIELSKDSFIAKAQRGEIGEGTGSINPKDAIRRYGEKYRGQVFFVESKHKNEK